MQNELPRLTRTDPGPPPSDERRAQLATLTRVNTADMLAAFGLGQTQRSRPLLELACRRPAQRFARHAIRFDDIVGAAGLQAGGAWAVRQFVRRIVVSGAEHLPRNGPLLIVANHPGLADTIALFAATPRPDLRIVAADRPFLRALPNLTRYLFTLDEAQPGRMGLVRSVARHLRSGGAVLNFPGGRIEPDPATLPGAAAALAHWSESIDLFARLAAEVAVVPAIVSGVLSPAALHHPLTRLRRRPEDRLWLGAMLQILFPALNTTTVRVIFGQPIAAADLRATDDATAVSRAVLAVAHRLIAQSEEAAAAQ